MIFMGFLAIATVFLSVVFQPKDQTGQCVCYPRCEKDQVVTNKTNYCEDK